MKNPICCVFLLSLFLPLITAQMAHADTMTSPGFIIDRSVVAGGGGGAGSANYTMPGSATGQSSAPSDLSSPNYSVTGGYFGGPMNTPPVAADQIVTTPVRLPYSGTLSASDPDSDPLTYSIVTDGSKGTAVITNTAAGSFIYTPSVNITGSDSFTFKANDGASDSNIATVTFMVIDTLPPTVAINPVVTPTTNTSQTVTGTMEAGATVAVTVNTGATVGTVTYPTTTSWSVQIANLSVGANIVTVTAKDTASNIYSTTATINVTPGKPGDCDGSGTISIDEVQSAINMYLGLKAITTCVDTSGEGAVSINEVQKVINGYLGL